MADSRPTSRPNTRPIGIFDSGLGGLTVLKEVRRLLPHENIVYFGDNSRTPYGTKSVETVVKYTLQDIRFLLSQDVKAVVIACNTASACGLERARAEFDLPIVEVVAPGSRKAVLTSKTGRIGVIGTAATIGSGVYERAVIAARDELAPDMQINYFGKACPLFVPLVEEGWWDKHVTALAAREYLEPLREADIDTLVLGCTHYPLLSQVVQDIMGDSVQLINSALEVAKEIARVLDDNKLSNITAAANCGNIAVVDDAIDSTATTSIAATRFYTSDSAEKFAELGGRFLGAHVDDVEKVPIEIY